MKQRVYAVFLDLDGTLMVRGHIPPRNITAIAAVRRRGHRVFLNTGRSRAGIPRLVLDQITFDGLVAGIGSYITYQDEILYRVTIPQPLLQETAAFLWQKGCPHVFEGEDNMLYARMEAPANLRNVLYLDEQHKVAGSYQNERITKATIPGVLSDSDRAYLGRAFTVFQHDTYAEIALQGCSKADGMRRVLDRLGLDRQHSIAMGDSANDLDMLEAAGISIAMGNANEEIRAISTGVTADVVDSGVALALENLLLRDSEQ